MKRTAISFMAQGRRRYLYRRQRGGVFYIRFQYEGKPTPRSLGTTIEASAIERAKNIITAEYDHDEETSRRLKRRNEYAPLEAIAAVYRSHFVKDRRTRLTAQNNLSSLAKLVRLGAGTTLKEGRVNVLTGECVRRFEMEEEKRIERDNSGFMLQKSECRVRTTICANIRQARSIFKKSSLHWYDGLLLPDLKSFMAQGVRAPERPKPTRLDDGVIEAIKAAAPALAESDPAVYAAFLLFSQAGLRNCEIRAARRNWIVRRPDGSAEIGIIYRPDEEWQPKKHTEGWVPISKEVTEVLLKISESDAQGYLIPAEHAAGRHVVVDHRHNEWVGQWIKNRSKISYELRRYAGSLYYAQTKQLAKVQKFLRHANLKTTMDWYWYLLDDLEPLTTPAWMTVVESEPAAAAA